MNLKIPKEEKLRNENPSERREELKRMKIIREQERMQFQMKKVHAARLKRKRMNDYKMKQKEAMRNRKSLENVNLEYNEKGRRIEENYLKAL